MGKVIGILSLKGGVGKTSTVVGLGAAISNFGKKVLLIDGNLSCPNLGMHLDIINPDKTIHHVLSRDANPSDAIYCLGDLDVIPALVSGKVECNPLKLKDRIKNLKRKYDVVLIDSSPALNEETLAVILAADELFVVTTPDYPTLSMTLKAVRLAKKRGTNIDGLIINKAYNKGFELSAKDIEKTSEVPVLAVIPYDVDVLKALSKSTPYTLYRPKSEGSIEYKKLAGSLIGERYKSRRIKDLFRKITPKKHEINRELFYNRVFNE